MRRGTIFYLVILILWQKKNTIIVMESTPIPIFGHFSNHNHKLDTTGWYTTKTTTACSLWDFGVEEKIFYFYFFFLPVLPAGVWRYWPPLWWSMGKWWFPDRPLTSVLQTRPPVSAAWRQERLDHSFSASPAQRGVLDCPQHGSWRYHLFSKRNGGGGV